MAIHLVQYQPEIPQNTGNIMRTCAATNIKLHLIKPLGFSLDEKNIKRAGANYIQEADYSVYEDWADFSEKNKQGTFYFCSPYAKKNYSQMDFSNIDKDYFIILGTESSGIPKAIWLPYIENCFRIPMSGRIDSLNVSNVGAVMAYEALRQQQFSGLE